MSDGFCIPALGQHTNGDHISNLLAPFPALTHSIYSLAQDDRRLFFGVGEHDFAALFHLFDFGIQLGVLLLDLPDLFLALFHHPLYRLEEQQIQPHRQDDEGDQMQYDALPFQPQRFKRVCGKHLVFDKVYHVAPLQ